MRSRRLIALIAVIVVLVAGFALDRRRPAPATATTAALAVRTSGMPVAPPARGLNASWYCPGAGATLGGPFDGYLVLLNPGDGPLRGTITVVPAGGAGVTKDVTVPPRGETIVRESDVLQAPVAAALVEFQGGVGVVEQAVGGPAAFDGGPCATAGSDRWYLAAGTTERDATLLVTLFNPFPGDAIVDLSFATDQGPAAPGEFQGLVVPARGMVSVNIGDHVRRRNRVSTTVVVRSGRVVAGRLQVQNTPSGGTATLAAPAPEAEWQFPDGVAADGVREAYDVYNPGDKEAQVQVAMVLDQGEAEPFQLTVPPHAAVDLVTNDQTRVPKGVAHAAIVSSTNGVGVVVERVVEGVKPSTRLGTAAVMGSRMAAKRWLFAWGAASSAFDEWVTVFNPGDRPASVSIVAEAGGQELPVEGLQAVAVPPGRRVALRLGDHIVRNDLGLLVDANAPVIAERSLFAVKGVGMSGAIGIPFP